MSGKPLLICGIKQFPTDEEVSEETKQKAMQAVQADVKRLQDEGFATSLILVDPRQSDDENIKQYREILASRSEWHGISIGFGVRGDARLTPLFEKLINITITDVKPPFKMAFPEMFDKLYESVRRVFPA